MDRGAWRATVHSVAKHWTQLKQLSMQSIFFLKEASVPLSVLYERFLFCFVFLIRVKLNVLFHKSGEIVCWILHCSLVAQSCPTLCNPMDCVHPHATRQAPLSMGFPRQEYRSGLPFPSPGDLPVIEPACLALAGRFFTADSLPPGKPWVLHQSDHWL